MIMPVTSGQDLVVSFEASWESYLRCLTLVSRSALILS
jgi:hypothetical protein